MNENKSGEQRKATFRKCLLRYKRKLILGGICLVLTQAISLAAPWILKNGIDSIKTGSVSTWYLARFAGMLLGITIVAQIFRYGMRMQMVTASRDMEYDLRNDLFKHLQTLSASFFDRMRTGDIMARATNDLKYVRSFLGPGIMYMAGTIQIPFAGALMFKIDSKLALWTLIPIPIMSALVYIMKRAIYTRSRLRQEQYSAISAMAQENFTGIRVVKAYSNEDREIAAFDEGCKEYLKRNMALARIDGLMYPMFGMVIGTMITIIVAIGGRGVIEGRMTLGELTAFLSYATMMLWPTGAVGSVVNLYQAASAALNRINEILTTDPEIADGPDVSPVTSITGAVEFRNVWFQYNAEAVLKDVSLTIPSGSTVAIVGRTGSGKSTLAHLIPRLYDPVQGRVLIGGRDATTIPLDALRRSIGVVPQETFLFSDSIKSNIAYGKSEASDSEVARAVSVSHILEELEEFPQGIDTELGERGVNLSGGQKQRVAISRAIVKKPSILVLDDALSSVDTQTEEDILRDLLPTTTGVTTIIIAHRMSTVKNADLIVVLDEGKIVEQGTHDELLAHDGIYAFMYRQQLLEKEIAEG